ncbi:MAG: hypothetical protein AB1449_07200 [Chloroflexota bacterium]
MAGEDNWKAKTLLIGMLVGALTGLGAAYLLVRRAEETESRPRLTPGLGMRLGLLVLGLLRQVGRLGEGDG